jgi:V-type H+-transporting ATPase subunit E
MKERNKCLLEIRESMVKKLRETMKSDRKRYLETVKNLILQGMIKLLEPSLQIKCRKDDLNDIKGMLKDLETKYHKYMTEQTKRDEYSCTLTVLDDTFLTDDKDQGCGGIILYTENSRIVCPNTLINRLDLSFEELLP